MKYDPDRHHRRSIRLKDYDYTQPGAYFITICTFQRECFLSEIVDGQIQLTETGEIVQGQWLSLPSYHPYVASGEFIIMPNHLHGLIVLKDLDARAGLLTRPYKKRQGIPDLVRGFKTYSARKINARNESQGVSIWQRDYYDHICGTTRNCAPFRNTSSTTPHVGKMIRIIPRDGNAQMCRGGLTSPPWSTSLPPYSHSFFRFCLGLRFVFFFARAIAGWLALILC